MTVLPHTARSLSKNGVFRQAVKKLAAGLVLLPALGGLALPPAAARVLTAHPHNYRPLLRTLQPGDTLLLAPGVYRRGLPLHHLQGEPGRPIVISGQVGAPRPLFPARAGHNTVSLIDSAHLTVRRLHLDGRNLPADGVKCEGPARWAHHIVLEDLLIERHGYSQQTVGISTKCPAWDWTIRGNVITGAGTGMYLGNSDGSDPFVRGLIENNLVVDSVGYDLQIKHQKARPPLAGLAGPPAVTVIRDNVFVKRTGLDVAGMARPNVLVGHWPLAGAGAEDRYLIYRNVFYDNPHGREALFQGEGNIALYNNLFVNPRGDGIHIQPHNDVPREIDIFFNTVVAAGTGIAVRRGQRRGDYTQYLTGNAVFARVPVVGGVQGDNRVGPYEAAGRYLTAPYAPFGRLDLYPKGYLGGRAVADLRLRAYPEWNRDFNGTVRAGRFYGAYSGVGTNPGWRPRFAPKPRLSVSKRAW
ncbi:MAG TPA: hypothetical protein ENJ19_09920 [Gammaproteobacteria bacterium]|nr:hypothetical protein [Gammaproteobacteria bacterium]